MKDSQAKADVPGSIPILSPLLHHFSMPLLVFLRHSFGYAFLRSKSIFLSSIFACCLLSYIVWNEPALKSRFASLSCFLLTASALYMFHLLLSLSKNAGGRGEHDQDAGSSHLLSFLGSSPSQKSHFLVHCLAEPAIFILLAVILPQSPLTTYFVFAGIALAWKELIRSWLSIRTKKRLQDSIGDAKANIETTVGDKPTDLVSKGRSEREKLTRRYDSEETEEYIYAEILRLIPPYSLPQAELNFAALLSDEEQKTPVNDDRIDRLNTAIGYFRGKMPENSEEDPDQW